MTVPHIELSAAVTGARLSNFVSSEVELSVESVWYWSDSQSTIRYLKNKTRRYSVFVSNRVNELQDTTDLDA